MSMTAFLRSGDVGNARRGSGFFSTGLSDDRLLDLPDNEDRERYDESDDDDDSSDARPLDDDVELVGESSDSDSDMDSDNDCDGVLDGGGVRDDRSLADSSPNVYADFRPAAPLSTFGLSSPSADLRDFRENVRANINTTS